MSAENREDERYALGSPVDTLLDVRPYIGQLLAHAKQMYYKQKKTKNKKQKTKKRSKF